jgi:serine/threonine protein kinase
MATFTSTPPVELSSLLPHLPPSATLGQEKYQPTVSHSPSPVAAPFPNDLIRRLLVYTPSSRLKAAEALQHPWFAAKPTLILPVNYPVEHNIDEACIGAVFEGRPLADWLHSILVEQQCW